MIDITGGKMNLPSYLQQKINLVFSELDKSSLKSTQKNLTDKYKKPIKLNNKKQIEKLIPCLLEMKFEENRTLVSPFVAEGD